MARAQVLRHIQYGRAGIGLVTFSGLVSELWQYICALAAVIANAVITSANLFISASLPSNRRCNARRCRTMCNRTALVLFRLAVMMAMLLAIATTFQRWKLN